MEFGNEGTQPIHNDVFVTMTNCFFNAFVMTVFYGNVCIICNDSGKLTWNSLCFIARKQVIKFKNLYNYFEVCFSLQKLILPVSLMKTSFAYISYACIIRAF